MPTLNCCARWRAIRLAKCKKSFPYCASASGAKSSEERGDFHQPQSELRSVIRSHDLGLCKILCADLVTAHRGDPGADLYLPSTASLYGLCQLQGPQGYRNRSEGRLQGRGCRRCPAGARGENSALAARYPAIAPSWRRAWNGVIPFLDHAPEVRKLIYTTYSIEALNATIRRAVRTRGHSPMMKPLLGASI